MSTRRGFLSFLAAAPVLVPIAVATATRSQPTLLLGEFVEGEAFATTSYVTCGVTTANEFVTAEYPTPGKIASGVITPSHISPGAITARKIKFNDDVWNPNHTAPHGGRPPGLREDVLLDEHWV